MKPTKMRNRQTYRATNQVVSKQISSPISKDLRKKYARGPGETEVLEMDEEVITPYDLQKEEGVENNFWQILNNSL